ncbi:hypothetical protein FRZ44_04880 [Hypericibacter terrae]|uniref:Uncharacterized protein n=1 Tax=Hypericibacter terrae TaxID=2602015 RepID=A0A5J6MCU8_9PROT|nr:hypothetical protein FRZ44_04880 [Hypericibacter terrae]
MGIDRPRNRIAIILEARKCVARGSADIETIACAGILTVAPPSDEPLHQIPLIEGTASQQGICEAERHARIVGPLSRLEAKWSATLHIDQRGPTIAPAELECRSDGIADSEADKRTDGTVPCGVVSRLLGHCVARRHHRGGGPTGVSTICRYISGRRV